MLLFLHHVNWSPSQSTPPSPRSPCPSPRRGVATSARWLAGRLRGLFPSTSPSHWTTWKQVLSQPPSLSRPRSSSPSCQDGTWAWPGVMWSMRCKSWWANPSILSSVWTVRTYVHTDVRLPAYTLVYFFVDWMWFLFVDQFWILFPTFYRTCQHFLLVTLRKHAFYCWKVLKVANSV